MCYINLLFLILIPLHLLQNNFHSEVFFVLNTNEDSLCNVNSSHTIKLHFILKL